LFISRMKDLMARSYADKAGNNISQHVVDISKKVNGGTIGLAERVTLFVELRNMIEAELNYL
jgi:predicted chitinase